MRTLTAPPLVLEPLEVRHAHEMFTVLGDPAIYEFEREAPPSEAWLAERYRRLEARRSPDASQQWLNWVVRMSDGTLAGYVQATVTPAAESFVAYELASRHWRQGIGSVAVAGMLDELRDQYGVRTHVAVLKARNHRSLGLLRKLGFERAPDGRFPCDADEVVMMRAA